MDALASQMQRIEALTNHAAVLYQQWQVGIWADANEIARERPDIPTAVVRLVRDMIAVAEADERSYP